jgi:hypothetical protein
VSTPRLSEQELIDILAPSLGEEAAELVRGAAKQLGLAPGGFDRSQALAVLDTLAIKGGLIRYVSTYGKSRVLLRFKGNV